MLYRPYPNAMAIPASVVKILLQTVTAEWELEEREAILCVERALDWLHLEDARQRSVQRARVQIAGGLTPAQVKAISSYIRDHIHLSIRLDELLRLTQLSRSQFQRSFKLSFGHSPHQHIARRRVSLAQDLMGTTNGPLCEIALCCGFSDQSHFNRVFLQITGRTPGNWRRSRPASPPEEGTSFAAD